MTVTRPVVIILVNWNNEPDTAECLESCRKLCYPEFSMIVVDNGSADGSGERLRQRFPDVEVIETGRNLGFAGGNNIGIRRALETGADYIWLLNNDTVVDRCALSALVEVAEQDRTVGMAGSKVLCFDVPGRIWYAGGLIDDHAPYRCSHRGVSEEDVGQYDDPSETGYVTGCSLLVRRNVIEQIGQLDEGMFLYFEDTDWGVRARKAGWRLIYAPRSLVLHKVSVSMGGMDSPRMFYYLARNLLYFIRKNYPRVIVRAFGFDLFQHVLVMAKKGRWAAAGWAFRGIVDFLRGRTGPL
ncbi:MAG: glycosyltransferase family 2 protein [Geobacteraceae bacterium]|jgi:GT2 family glycosyltransferase